MFRKSLIPRISITVAVLVTGLASSLPSGAMPVHAGRTAVVAQAAPTALNAALIKFQVVGSGFDQPLAIVSAPDASRRLYIVQRGGKIFILRSGKKLAPAFLDVSSLITTGGSEQGLLGLAFHPDYASNGQFYTVYTRASDGSLVLSRFLRSAANSNRADPASRQTLLVIPHPVNHNHNGGNIVFGPDGYLYWGTGDGGGAGDTAGNAQNLTVRLGKLLRIDVDHTDPGLQYAIPTDNPFYGSATNRQEIWDFGFRNPWRFSFDRQTGDLFIGDVGQSNWEEVDMEPAGSAGGSNYGWNLMEGTHCYPPGSSCSAAGKVLPVTEYSHSLGCSITGGFMYRGVKYELLQGHYFYGDFCTGRLFDLYPTGPSTWAQSVQLDTPYNITTFGQDQQGGVYMNDYGSGTIYRIRYKMRYHFVDFNGNGTTDISYFRPSTGTWTIRNQFTLAFGQAGDIPVPADYNGDSLTDIAVFRPSTGEWLIKDQAPITHGTAGDVPVPGDYDGNGSADIAYFRPSSATWSVLNQPDVTFGQMGDIPVPGDYNNDGKTDMAVFRPSNQTWHIRSGSNFTFGQPGDIPVPGDYDGDGGANPAVFHPATATWSIRKQTTLAYGMAGDIPVPGDYNGNGTWEVAVFRPSDGTWHIRGRTSVTFGMAGDYPLPAPDTNGDGEPYQ